MLKPRIFFDTSICIDVADGAISLTDWQGIWKRLTTHFRYCISPLTLNELLIGLGRGDTEHFCKNQQALRVLSGTSGRRKFLKFPGRFVIENVLGIQIPQPKFEPRDFEGWLGVALRARDKESLESGRVDLKPYGLRTFGMNLAVIDEQTRKGKKDHAEALNRLRGGTLRAPSAKQWAASFISAMGIRPIRDEACAKLALALDAAYRFDQCLWRLARESNYNFNRHDTDWVDLHQLYYLCTEDVHVLTSDRDLTERTAGSLQRDRILKASEICRFLD